MSGVPAASEAAATGGDAAAGAATEAAEECWPTAFVAGLAAGGVEPEAAADLAARAARQAGTVGAGSLTGASGLVQVFFNETGGGGLPCTGGGAATALGVGSCVAVTGDSA